MNDHCCKPRPSCVDIFISTLEKLWLLNAHKITRDLLSRIDHICSQIRKIHWTCFSFYNNTSAVHPNVKWIDYIGLLDPLFVVQIIWVGIFTQTICACMRHAGSELPMGGSLRIHFWLKAVFSLFLQHAMWKKLFWSWADTKRWHCRTVIGQSFISFTGFLFQRKLSIAPFPFSLSLSSQLAC